MAKVYEFLANGTEEIEALIVVDILRRGGVDVKMVSTTGTEYIESSHGIVIKCDEMIENSDFSDADMLLLPGGQPGTTNLMAHEGVRKAISAHYAAGKKIGAICAAPMVLGDLGPMNSTPSMEISSQVKVRLPHSLTPMPFLKCLPTSRP